ncbi:MAG: hypothetical protein KC468_05155, partial [Myxococcales bacterium]|nr:hypothetical protein [Myxococcales bacterium]
MIRYASGHAATRTTSTRARDWVTAAALASLVLSACARSQPGRPSTRSRACRDPAAQLEGYWDQARRDQLSRALARLADERAPALRERSLASLDAVAHHWIRARRRACADAAELGRGRYHAIGECHEIARAALGELAAVATEHASVELLGRLPAAAALAHDDLLACQLVAASPEDLAADTPLVRDGERALARAEIDAALG